MNAAEKTLMWAKGFDVLAKVLITVTTVLVGWIVSQLDDLADKVNANATEIAVIHGNRWTSQNQAEFLQMINAEHHRLWQELTSMSARIPKEFPPAAYVAEQLNRFQEIDRRLRALETR